MASILTVLASFPPEAWDAVVPRQRVAALGRLSDRMSVRDGLRGRADLVALNPQPLPPAEQFLVEAAELAHSVGRLAVETDLVAGGGTALLKELVDDWCGTGWPRRWPFPWPGPGPRPDEATLAGGQVLGAVVLAGLGERMPGTELGEAFTQAAEQMMGVAVPG